MSAPPSQRPSLGAEAEARARCEQVLNRYFRCVDEGRASEAAPLFAPDAMMVTIKTSLDGHAAIAAALEARQAATDRSTAHVATNFDFELVGDASATAHGLLLMFTGAREELPPTPAGIARYDARFASDAGGTWQIAELVIAKAA